MKQQIKLFLTIFLVSWNIGVFAETKVLDYIKIIVNNEILTNNEVQAAMEAMRAQILQSTREGNLRDEQIQQLEETAIENLVNELLLLDRAKKLRISVTEDEIERYINQLAQSNPQLTTNYDPSELKEWVSKDFLKQRVIQREVGGNIRITEEELKAFCEETMEQTKEVEIAQILFRGSEEEAQSKIELIKNALAQGTDFAELAKIYSEDPNAKQTGGKLGRFQKGQLLSAIEEAAFSLKKQQLSDLVQSEYGFHLLYLYDVGYPAGDCSSFSPNQRTQYHNQLFDKKHQATLQTYLNGLRKSAQIVIH